MARRYDPSADLPHPLSYVAARARGITAGSLASAAVDHPFWGVVSTPVDGMDEADPDGFVRRCREISARMRPYQFFSHGTALRLCGAPVPAQHAHELHIAAHRPAREPRTSGVIGHRLQQRSSAAGVVGGLAIEHPVRAWRQAGRRWNAMHLAIAGDFIVARRRPLATIAEIRDELALMGSTAALDDAVEWLRVGSESPQETRLRIVLIRGGLPEPELNVDLHDERGRFVGRLDLLFRRYRVAVEYDGRRHAEDTRQFQRDADRWDAIRHNGVELVRILNHHMAGDGRVALEKVRRALQSAGWPDSPHFDPRLTP